MTGQECEKMAPESYLRPELFVTEFDGRFGDDKEYRQQQYDIGLKTATEYPSVSIACNGTWGASGNGSSLTTYERIGYHRATSDLLKGLLAGTATVTVYRYKETGHPFATVIKS